MAITRKMELADFNRAWKINGDGCGFAKFKGEGDKKTVYFRKAFEAPQAAWDFSQELELPYVMHLRKQSSGSSNKLLTHPFIIANPSLLDLEGEASAVLFMNGTEGWAVEFANAAGIYPKKDDITNDSHLIAQIIAKDNYRFLETLKSKFVVLDKKNDRFQYYSGNGKFINDNDEIWYSNDSYQESKVCHVKKKTQKISTPPIGNSMNCGTNISNKYNNIRNLNQESYNFDKPWESTNDQKHRVLRYLLNKLTPNAGKNLWNRYQKKQILDDALEKAIKVLKQQNKEFTIEKEKRIRSFIKADTLVFPYSATYLRDNGIKTLNIWEDSCDEDNKNKKDDREGHFLGIENVVDNAS